MATNDKRLIQSKIKEYAGPISERPSTLPFGDYYFAEDTQVLYKYNYQGMPIQIGANGSQGDTIYTADNSIVGTNRIVTLNDLGDAGVYLGFHGIGSGDKESNIQIYSDEVLLNSNFDGQITLEVTDTQDNTTFLSSAGIQITNSESKLIHEVGDGIGGTLSESSIKVDVNGMLVVDTTANTGMMYADDYSAQWTDRSIVDKAYVDNNGGGSSNTIYESDGEISSNRTVTGVSGRELKFEMYDNTISTYYNRGEFYIIPDSVTIAHYTGDETGGDLSETSLRLDSNQIIAQSDNENFEGIKYGGDYSSTFTERTLVDKEYVDNAIAGSDTFYDGDGTISGTRTVTVDDYGSLQYFVYNGITTPDDGIGFFTLDYESFQLGFQDTTNGIVRSSFSWVDGVGFELEDDNLQLGIRYKEDYSANYGPRSLVDKAYVDGQVTAPEWGNITGTLSNQTDLQNALNLKINLPNEGNQGDYRSIAILNSSGDNLEYTTDIKIDEFTKQVIHKSGSSSEDTYELLFRADNNIDKFSINYDSTPGHLKSLSGNNIKINNFIFPETGDEFTFPNLDGTNNQVLSTDGSGNLSFTTISQSGSIYTEDGILSGNREVLGEQGIDLAFVIYDTNPLTYSERGDIVIASNSIKIGKYTGDGSGDDQAETSISVEDSQIRINSTNSSFGGLKYDGDYSSNFTSRSLVDKDYVDSIDVTTSWGEIVGTLSDQSDLQGNLDAKINLPSEGNQGSQRSIVILNADGDDLDYTSDIKIDEATQQTFFKHGSQTSSAHEIVFRDTADVDQFIINKDYTPGKIQTFSGNNLQLNSWIIPETSIDIFTLPQFDGNNGEVLSTDGSGNLTFIEIPGGGDMLKSVYDPSNKDTDTFDMDNMDEGVNNKILTSSERSEIASNTSKISYTDASAVALNTAKISFDSVSSTRLANTSGTNTGDQDLSGLALKTNVLELDNATLFVPTSDYQPATKKYVDDNSGGSGGVERSKSITIENPSSGADITLFRAKEEITISELAAVIVGTVPTVDFQIFYSTDRSSSSPTQVGVSTFATDNTSTGNTFSGLGLDNTIVTAGSWVWLSIESTSGTVEEWSLTITY